MAKTTNAMLTTLGRITSQVLKVLVPGDDMKISTDVMSLYTAKDDARTLLGKDFHEGETTVGLPSYCKMVQPNNDQCDDDKVVSVSVSNDGFQTNIFMW